jgi:hypothetical protein
MFKNLILIITLCFIFIANIVNAETITRDAVSPLEVSSIDSPLANACPSTAVLAQNKDWVEHAGVWNKSMGALLTEHFSLPLAPVKANVALSLITVNVDRGMGITPSSEILWSVYRTNQTNFSEKNTNCHVLGSVAYYVEVRNDSGWPPKVMFINNPDSEKQWLSKGTIGLIEFRWYDPVDQKRHRWFNSRLALYLQWVKGASDSPIFLPRAVNTLE